ncbi:MAG: glycine cleavage system protein GcvH [Arenicellales bacterium]|jgi:glycine cleavage system H protein|nr:glycine cleavage system protein H [Acidiferrobacteraceae bacterium]MDP6122355.1 glycine cleavage system protein GcvH [Arenicellales bacterium]MBT59765.1 glycine cleavage system protein H [Acidiferrobacteraceae bacterium]MBT59825.1 glycine cleavage system protein H [Acidiferrobacteraceae bacterium]MDP6289910.1 glycine cleavage system protein GcvH [Arenicellales bacterium]|tara:strand:+ start:1819 stop:2196 length:378 start_codon:yes stop_codon:yes gene_type:complete
MSEMRFSEDHEWALRDESNQVTIGITDFAQEQLGEIVFIELPEVGSTLSQGDEAAVIESVKAASEIKSPISGEVVAVNEALIDEPGEVNQAPLGEGWFYKLKPTDPTEFDSLMDSERYQAMTADQ